MNVRTLMRCLAGAMFAAVCAGCETITPATATTTYELAPEYESFADDAVAQGSTLRDAAAYLVEMTRDPYPGYRANAIEGLQADEALGEEAARAGLLDENLGVRFAAAMSIGLNKYASSATLTHALLQDDSESVQAAAIFALRRNGYNVNVSPLAEMLKSTDQQTRSNAALVLGELGDPSAIPLLREALEFDLPQAPIAQLRVTQLQIAEALIKLGDETALTRVRAHLFSDDPAEGETRALAALILGRAGDRRSRDFLVTLVARWREHQVSAEVRLAAMAALAMLGDPPPAELPAEYLGPRYAQAPTAIRAQAAYTLGEIGGPVALGVLAQEFERSEEPMVRLQAASALLRLLTPAAGSGR